jgi:hypothetical protein
MSVWTLRRSFCQIEDICDSKWVHAILGAKQEGPDNCQWAFS